MELKNVREWMYPDRHEEHAAKHADNCQRSIPAAKTPGAHPGPRAAISKQAEEDRHRVGVAHDQNAIGPALVHLAKRALQNVRDASALRSGGLPRLVRLEREGARIVFAEESKADASGNNSNPFGPPSMFGGKKKE